MPIPIIEQFQLGTNLSLDARYVADTYFDVSLYWYAGMQVFQTSDSQLYWYDGSVWIPVVDTSLSGNFATISYVDGSLALRDASISSLFLEDERIDSSLNLLFLENDIQDSSIIDLRNRINITDSSLSSLTSLVNIHDASIGIIEDELIRIDGSLNFILPQLDQLDASIIRLDNEQSIQDSSITFLTNQVNQLDASIQRIDASLGDYVRKDGDTMSGDLLIETDLSVNGKGTFGELNVSGDTFPSSPSGGDLFYRSDISQMFSYDPIRGKWLSMDKATYVCGRNRANGNTTVYMNIGDSAMSSITGLSMPRNGTIIAVSLDNDNITTANRTLDIRVNNSTTNRVQLTVTTGNKGASLVDGDQDFNAGDILQAVLLANNSDRFDDVLVTFEVAWRI